MSRNRMKIGIGVLLILFVFFFRQDVSGEDLIINEILSSNNSILQDIDGDYSDWIELYNPTDDIINLQGYSLSDNILDLTKWTFPDVEIQPQSYLLVFASSKDKFEDGELHTNFKLSKDGEPLILSNNGEVIDQTIPSFIPTDQSLSRISDTIDQMMISSSPTPNEENQFTEGVYASHITGFYDQPFNLELTSINNNHTIYYTVNGGTPTTNSRLYTEPIEISNESLNEYSYSDIPTTPLEGPYQLDDFIWKEPLDIYKFNVIKFAAFENGVPVSDVKTQSYFIDSSIESRFDFNIVSLTTDSLNLFDHDTGIYVPGARFAEVGFDWWPEGNYHNRGAEWERRVHLTYLNKQGEVAFESNAGMRMRGYGSAANPQKSFNIYFRGEYGMSNVEYPIFDNYEAEKYKRIIFRNSGGDFVKTHFRDALLQEVMSTMNLEKQDFKPSILFLNGEYWGIHNLREKYDKHYLRYKCGADEDSLDVLSICGEIEEGDNADYLSLLDFVNSNNLYEEDNFQYVKSQIDLDNFIDFQIAEIYFANYDWPCNNYKIWRENGPESKWRFLIYDLDYSFSESDLTSYTTNSIDHAASTSNDWPHCNCSNSIFRNLLVNEEFKLLFLEKFQHHLESTFSVDRINSIIDDFTILYSSEIQNHINRWGYPESINEWEAEIEKMREFARERPCYMVSNIVSFFGLTEFGFDCTDNYSELFQEIVFAPNPTNGSFSIYNNSDHSINNGSAFVSNSQGQIVHEASAIMLHPGEKYYFSLTGLATGVYVLAIECQDKLLSRKFIVQ